MKMKPQMPQVLKDNWKWILVGAIAGLILGLIVGCQHYATETRLADGKNPEVSTSTWAVGLGRAVASPEVGEATIDRDAASAPSISWKDRVKSTSLWMLYPIGGLCLVAGIVVAIWLKQMMAGAGLAAGGVAVIIVAVVFETQPIAALVIFGLALAGAGVWVIWGTKTGLQIRQALGFERKISNSIIVGVEAVKDERNSDREAIDKTLKAAADKDVQREIKARKANGALA